MVLGLGLEVWDFSSGFAKTSLVKEFGAIACRLGGGRGSSPTELLLPCGNFYRLLPLNGARTPKPLNPENLAFSFMPRLE